MMKAWQQIKRLPFEAFIWIGALLFLALSDPLSETHFTLCPLRNAGFQFCPGCGLGKSISLIFNGYYLSAFSTHPLGLFAIIVLSYRSIYLILSTINSKT